MGHAAPCRGVLEPALRGEEAVAGLHWNACHRSLKGRRGGFCISHSNQPSHSWHAHHNHGQGTALVSGEQASEVGEGTQACGLCREAPVSPLGREEDNSLLCQVEGDSPPPLVPLWVCFLRSEHGYAFLGERKHYPSNVKG